MSSITQLVHPDCRLTMDRSPVARFPNAVFTFLFDECLSSLSTVELTNRRLPCSFGQLSVSQKEQWRTSQTEHTPTSHSNSNRTFTKSTPKHLTLHAQLVDLITFGIGNWMQNSNPLAHMWIGGQFSKIFTEMSLAPCTKFFHTPTHFENVAPSECHVTTGLKFAAASSSKRGLGRVTKNTMCRTREQALNCSAQFDSNF